MKIVILNGSPRKHGSTAYVLLGIRPFVIRKGADYSGVLNRWRENGLAK